MAKASFPSLQSLAENFAAVLKRFPLEILFALAGTWAAIETTLAGNDLGETTWLKVIFCSNLGLVFSLSASTWTASLRTREFVIWLLRALIMGLAFLYFFTLPDRLRQEDVYRFFLLAAAGHVLVSVAPFWEKGNILKFWYYNKTLFLRFLTAALYSAVLFAGLAVALLALDELFGINIEGELYFRLWIVIAGLFNTIMFLAGVPEQPPGKLEEEVLSNEPEQALRKGPGQLPDKEPKQILSKGSVQPLGTGNEGAYPKALKIFTQYVLIPLVSIYVLILLAYELKILVQWDLPRGWVSNLIIAFAVFGVLSLLLVFPVRHSSENKWIIWYGKTFHWILLPLVALLFLAIGTRIADYGFTEERFIVLITGIWLLYTALYFLSGRRENIKMIPASLIVVILLALTLAFPVSVYSQKQRLFAIFDRNNMLKTGSTLEGTGASGQGVREQDDTGEARIPDHEAGIPNDEAEESGKAAGARGSGVLVIAAPEQPSIQDRQQITSIVNYLYRMHGSEPFKGHFTKIPEEVGKKWPDSRHFTNVLLNSIQVDPATRWNNVPGSGNSRYFNISVNSSTAIPVTGFDYQLNTTLHGKRDEFQAGDHTIRENLRPQQMKATLIIDQRDTLRFDMEPLITALMQEYIKSGWTEPNMAPENAFLERETGRYKVRLYLLNLSGRADANGVIDTTPVLNVQTGYLLKFKNSRSPGTPQALKD